MREPGGVGIFFKNSAGLDGIGDKLRGNGWRSGSLGNPVKASTVENAVDDIHINDITYCEEHDNTGYKPNSSVKGSNVHT